MRPERIKEMLDSTMTSTTKATTEFKDMLQLYIDNGVARAILLKPIQQELEISRRRMDTILMNCVESSEVSRELQGVLVGIFDVLGKELTH